MNPTKRRLADCQQIIGYYFSNPRLLETALTHSSLRAPDRECNERLEFLGDSVLGLVITEELYHLLPDQSEGELTRIKSAVVSRGALLSTSQRLGLQDYAEFARGVGRRDKLPASVVANLVEAIIGAIYLDAGYYPAREFVLRHMGDAIDDELNDRGAKNYKSLLQHEVQQSVGVTPTYRTLDADGPDHAKEFVVAAIIRGQEWGQANGPTKKDAEQEAARIALEGWGRRGRGRRRRRKRKGDDAAPAPKAPVEAQAPEGETPEEPEVAAPAPEPVAEPKAARVHDGAVAADAIGEELDTRVRRRKKRTRRRRRSETTAEDVAAADAAAIEAESAADEPAPEPRAKRGRERRRSRRAPKPAPEEAAAPDETRAEPVAEPEPAAAPKAKREPKPEREPAPAPKAKREPKRKPEPAPAPKAKREPKPKPEPTKPRSQRETPSAFGAGIDVGRTERASARVKVQRKKLAAPAKKPAPAPKKKKKSAPEGGFGAGI